MAPTGPARSLWTFLSGLIWGLSGGVGVMAWLLIKLLRFQHAELERRHAWARLKTKQQQEQQEQQAAAAEAPQQPSVTRWEDIDPDCRELLRGVDEALLARSLPRMDEHELAAAVAVIWGARDEAPGPRWVIQKAVDVVTKQRRAAGGAPS